MIPARAALPVRLAMTKQQEIEHWRKFVDELPEGYLRDAFEGSENAIEAAILNDVCLPSIEYLRVAREEMDSDVKALTGKVQVLKKEVKWLEGRAEAIVDGIRQLQGEAEKIARSAVQYANYAADLRKRFAEGKCLVCGGDKSGCNGRHY
jgi:hypothetical protein